MASNKCGGCQFWVKPDAEAAAKVGALGQTSPKVGACYGRPPELQGVMSPTGPQFLPMRPNTLESDLACSLFKSSLLH